MQQLESRLLPYTVCIALDYLDFTCEWESGIKSQIIAGILKYLDSGAYLLEDGWVGMQGIPATTTTPICPGSTINPKRPKRPISA